MDCYLFICGLLSMHSWFTIFSSMVYYLFISGRFDRRDLSLDRAAWNADGGGAGGVRAARRLLCALRFQARIHGLSSSIHHPGSIHLFPRIYSFIIRSFIIIYSFGLLSNH